MERAATPRRSPRLPAERVRDVFLAALAGASLVGAAILAVWILAPGWVEALDRQIVASYRAAVDERLERAAATLEQGRRAEGVRALEELLEGLAAVQKGDRFDPRKRRALGLLARELAREEPERALAAYDAWLAFDARDVEARVGRAELIARLPGRRPEALEQLAALRARIPGSWAAASAWAGLLRLEGRPEEARDALRDAARRLPWKLRWTGGPSAGRQRRRLIQPRWSDGRMAFEILLPPGTRSLALHGPAELAFELSGVSARLSDELGRPPLELASGASEPCDSGAPGGESAAPLLCWRLPQLLPPDRGALLAFRAVARPLPAGEPEP